MDEGVTNDTATVTAWMRNHNGAKPAQKSSNATERQAARKLMNLMARCGKSRVPNSSKKSDRMLSQEEQAYFEQELAAHSRTHQPRQPVQSQRYRSDFWGKAGGRKPPGPKAQAEPISQAQRRQLQADNQKDLQQCRELLLKLDPEDALSRLQTSKFPDHTSGSYKATRQGLEDHTLLDDQWLLEAADAFGVPHKHKVVTETKAGTAKAKDTCQKKAKTTRRRLQSDVLADVLDAIRRAREQITDTASGQKDLYRRLELSEHLKGLQSHTTAKEFDIETKIFTSQELRELVLVRSCPETLRITVVTEFVQRHGRTPEHTVEAEAFAYKYLQSALARRHVANDTGEQLNTADVSSWDNICASLPLETRPSWKEDWVLDLAEQYLKTWGDLDPDPKKEAVLAQGLKHVRGALYKDQKSKHGFMIRQQLTTQDIAKWEAAIPKDILWSAVRAKGHYVPAEAIQGDRHIWARTPFLCKPCGCYLCGQDFESKVELTQHWRQHHILQDANEKDLLDSQQVEEEMRKRIFWGETTDGPFEVRGQEQRRIIGAHVNCQTMGTL